MFNQNYDNSNLTPFYSVLMQSVSDAVIAMDSDMNITGWNQSAERIYGWTAEEVIGKHAGSILSTQYIDRKGSSAAINNFRRTGCFKAEVIQHRKDGRRIRVHASVNEIRDPAGIMLGMISVNKDVTEQKGLRERQSQHNLQQQDLIGIIRRSSLPKAIICADSGKVLFANAAFGIFFGLKNLDITGVPITELGIFGPDQEHALFSPPPGLASEENFMIETQVYTAASVKDILLHREVISWDEKRCYLTRYIDITAYKKSERMKMYAGLIRNLPNLINILQFEDVNDPLSLKIIGTNSSREDAKRTIGMYVKDISPDAFTSGRIEKYFEMLRNGTPSDMGVVKINTPLKSGEFYFHVVAFPLSKDTFCLSLEDVTAQKKKEEEIHIFNVQFTEAQRTVSMGTWEWDAVKNTVSYSPEFLRLCGIENIPTDSSVRAFIALIHPADRKLMIEMLEQAKENRKSFEVFHRILRPDGTERIIRNRVCVFVDKEEKNIRLAGITQDLTDEKVAEEKFVNLLESAPDAVVIINEAGKILIANSKSEKIFGLPRPEVTGRSIETFIPEQFHEKFRLQMKKGLEPGTESEHFEIYGKSAVKGEFPAELNLTAIQNEQGMWIAVVIRDITERKKIESDLRKRTQELYHSYKELEELNYVASHDLQEPLRNIINYIGLFEKQHKGKFDKETERYLDYIVRSAGHMKNLIRELLEFSNLCKNPIAEVVNLNSVVNDVLNDLSCSVNECGAEFDIGKLPDIKGDYNDMKRVFRNLLSNAVKFRNKEQRPLVKINCESFEGNWFFSVTDNGIGIDKRFSEKIFHIFQRLHTQEKYPGLGIGLAVCKKIITYNGGSIWVESAPGKGATFYFTLPR